MKFISALLFLLVLTLSACSQTSKNKNGGRKVDGEKVIDAPDHKAVDGFGGLLFVIRNPKDFVKEWLKPEQPNFDSAKTVKSNEPLGIIVLFASCKPNSDGICNTEVDYTAYKPDGSVYFERKGLELWKEKAPPKPNTQLGRAIINFQIQPTSPNGEYKVKAKVYDKNADISFELETQFILESK